MTHASLATFILGFICFIAFSWGVKGHFRSTGAVPPGMKLLSAVSIAAFGWFAWRLIVDGAGNWPVAAWLFGASLLLFAWAVAATRRTPPTLAFDDDRPSFLLHHGPYRWVRHPFYLAYLTFWTGTAIATHGMLAWAAPLTMLALYTHAATREERKFAHSELAAAYEAYRAKAGMFLPRPASLLAQMG